MTRKKNKKGNNDKFDSDWAWKPATEKKRKNAEQRKLHETINDFIKTVFYGSNFLRISTIVKMFEKKGYKTIRKTNYEKLQYIFSIYKTAGITIDDIRSANNEEKRILFEESNRRREKKKKFKNRALSKAKKDEFLSSYQWRKLRLQAIKLHGRRCQCCGASPENDKNFKLNVDHIKPRKKYPELALDLDNLQVLCNECNHGKGNWDETDFR